MMSFPTNELISTFAEAGNPEIARQQKAYMKGKSEYFGIKSPLRRELQKPFLSKDFRPEKSELESVVKQLWKDPHRELNYVAQELVAKYVRSFTPNDIELIEYMILTDSWWDTVDFIASNLVGPMFLKYEDLKLQKVDQWLKSGNIWLQRTCILFQLKYKTKLDTAYLAYIIETIPPTKEFFINKAIGWILREHSKTDPTYVTHFIDQHELSNLTVREALKHINKK